MARFQDNGAVSLSFNGSEKLETTGFGATVFGQLKTQQFLAGVSTFTSTVGIAESIFHIGDTNTSFGFPSADTFTVDTAGEERLRVASDGAITVSNDGTDADGANLTLKHINNNTTDVVSSLIFSNNVGEVARIQGETSGANNSGLISLYTDNAGTSAERLRITSDGDVGIGTVTPARLLHLHETSSSATLLAFTNTTTGSAASDGAVIGIQDDESLIVSNKENNHIEFHTNNTERLRVTGIGSVGIGTVAPEHAFVVRDDGLARIRIRNDSNAANSFASFNLKTRNGEWSMYADGSSGEDDYLKIFRQGSGTHLYFYESIDKIGINSAICQVDANGNTLGDSKFGFFTSETNTGFHVQTNGTRTLKVNTDGLVASGIVTASGGFDLGIHSAGTSVVSGPVKILNFVGSGNTFAYNASTDTIDISIAGGSGGGSGVTETDTTVSTTNPTGVGSFATASFRSASVIAQINQLNTDFQVGRYLMIHDGTTVTVVEESAVSTGSTMLGSFTGVIDGSNVELRVTLASAGVSTVTTKIDTVTV
jgi:hydrogenase maturation factor